MEIIDNEYMEEELDNNHSIGEVFKNQRHTTLDSLTKKIENNENDILVNISINNIVPFLKRGQETTELYDDPYWDSVVSLIIMNELKEKYGASTYHNLDVEKVLLTRAPLNEYVNNRYCMVSMEDVVYSISEMNLTNPRVHIILEQVKNDNIINELCRYLDGNLPFVTMIYSDGEVIVNSDKYDYMLFDKYEDGQLIESNNRDKRLTL